MLIIDTDKDGNIIIIFDSRWRFPELLGYSPDDPQYKALQELWEQVTGRKIPRDDSPTDSEPESDGGEPCKKGG